MPQLTAKQLQQAIPLREAARYFPSRPSIYTLRRWSTKGLSNGAKLATFRSGGFVCTTLKAIEEFVVDASGDPATARRQTQAEAELSQMGI